MARTVQKFDFDRTFQSKLVRTMFQNPEAARDLLEVLEPEMFDSLAHKWAVRKMRWAWKQYDIPATITMLESEAVSDVARGIIKEEFIDAYAGCIAKLKTAVPDKSYILDKAFDFARRVSYREFLIASADKLKKGKLDWEEVNSLLDRQRSFGTRAEGDLGQDFFSDVKGRIERRKTFDRNGIPTGTEIDKKLRHGGLPPKQLGVIIAPPGRGKSTALVWVGGSAIMVGKNVLHVSLELDEDVTAEKYDARLSKVSISSLNESGRLLRGRLRAVLKRTGAQLRIKYFPPASLTVEGLRAYVRRLESVKFYPHLIIIDYADNLSLGEFSRGYSDSDYNPLGRLYVALRGLAGELNIPIWTASQSNRESLSKKEIGMGDLADSFKKAHVSDVMVAIAQDRKEHARKVARLIIAKNRNGPTGSSHEVKFDTGRVRILTI